MRFIIFTTTLLAFVWSCYWFIMSNEYFNKLLLWSDISSADVSANFTRIRGFPNRFDTTITDLEIKQASFAPIKIDRLDVMRLSYDSSHYIFAAKTINNVFESNFTFSKGLVSAVSNDGFLPTIKFQGENIFINEKLIFDELSFKISPTTNLSKLRFSLVAKTADIKEGKTELYFKGQIQFNSHFNVTSLTGFVSNINTLKEISGQLFIKDTEGLDILIQRDPTDWKIYLKSKTPEQIPSLIRDLDIIVHN